MESAFAYFEEEMIMIENALKSIDKMQLDTLIDECLATLNTGHKIVASGLGKNVPICDKFVGTMLSMGMSAGFLHTNSAVHGDMGMVMPGDLVIILTKSGATSESVYLMNLLKKRKNVTLWLISFTQHSVMAEAMDKKIIINLAHEGDLWNIVPNNSTTLNLIVLQKIAIELSRRLNLSLEHDFKPNHPAGAIGAALNRV